MSRIPVVKGRCPACGQEQLALFRGRLRCYYQGCPRPCAAHEVLADAGTGHVVTVTETSWSACHPLIERLDDELLHCGISDFLEKCYPEPGKYLVTKAGDQWVLTAA